MGDDHLLLTEQHRDTKRYAILANEGDSVWLYLTAPGDARIVADVWVANVIEAPQAMDLEPYRSQSRPPPAPADVVGEGAQIEAPGSVDWKFLWMEDGEGIQVILNGSPRAALLASAKRGLCRAVAVEGPWGAPWPTDDADFLGAS